MIVAHSQPNIIPRVDYKPVTSIKNPASGNGFNYSGPSISGNAKNDPFFASGTASLGFVEANTRFQYNESSTKADNWYGVFAKASGANANGKAGVGNENTTIALKGVGDVVTVSANAGVGLTKDFTGMGVKGKASVLSGRATIELQWEDWVIEVGVTGEFLSVGAELLAGKFDDGYKFGWGFSSGPYGLGVLVRIMPPGL